MYPPQGASPQKHTFRTYIVLSTIIIAGIFLVLLLNNKSLGFTSAVVNENSDGTIEEENQGTGSLGTIIDGFSDTKSRKTTSTGSNEQVSTGDGSAVPFSLTFSSVPLQIEKEITVDELELEFTDTSTTILVNKDRLELSKFEEIPLKISGFKGKVVLEEGVISLDGSAKKLEVNHVVLYSKGEIDILITDLHYEKLNTNEIQLKRLKLPLGSGTLSIGSRLQYTLDNEVIDIFNYEGPLKIDMKQELALTMEGSMTNVKISGADLTVDLK